MLYYSHNYMLVLLLACSASAGYASDQKKTQAIYNDWVSEMAKLTVEEALKTVRRYQMPPTSESMPVAQNNNESNTIARPHWDKNGEAEFYSSDGE